MQPIAVPTHTASSISIQGFASSPDTVSASPSSDTATPGQIRSSPARTAASISIATKMMNTVEPMPASRFPFST